MTSLLIFASCDYSENNSPAVTSDNDISDIFSQFEENYSANIKEIKKAGKWTFVRYENSGSAGFAAMFNDSTVFANSKFPVDEFYFTDLSKMVAVLKQVRDDKNVVFKYIFKLNVSSNIWTLSYAEKKECTEMQDTYYFTSDFGRKTVLNDFESFDFERDGVQRYVFAKKNSLEYISEQLRNMRNDNIVLLKEVFTPEHAEELLQYYPVNPQNVITLNNIGFYLGQTSVNLPAIIILEAVLKEYPNRAIACLNLGDVFMKINMKIKGKAYYSLYIRLMKEKGKKNEIVQRAYM
jgi:hypothetical protein